MWAGRDADRLAAVERWTDWPMLILAAAFLPVFLLPRVLVLSPAVLLSLEALGWLLWAAFATELGLKTYLAPQRRRYLVTHWLDVLIVVVPFLRPLRLLRVLRLLPVALRLAVSLRMVLGTHGLGYALGIATAALFGIAGAVTLVEADAPTASITDYPMALWWAITTVTTVGYGDTAPVTTLGRLLGVLLMLVGIGVFGIFTAAVAAFFVEQRPQSPL